MQNIETLVANLKLQVSAFLINKGFDFLGAALIIFVGFLIARWTGDWVSQRLEKKDIEPPVKLLFARISRVLILFFAVLIAAGTLKIQIAPLIAGLSVIGVGVGLAMQGVLSNLVAGLLIIFIKPFRVGEYIDILGVNGQVTAIELFSTILAQGDKSRVVIPNRKIIGEILHNYGNIRQLDLSVGVAYASNPEHALRVVREIVTGSDKILKDPAPVIGITSLGDSSVHIAIKPWANLNNFGAAQFEINRAIIERFRAEKIEIPFPQREIRVLPNPGETPRSMGA
jgi:small conductance mechanosensitive channel